MANDAESVTIRAFVRAPYDQFVQEQTRFWNASGISVKLGSGGVDVQLESLRALLLGGLAFDTPPDVKGAAAEPDHVFPLYADRETANAADYKRKIPLLAYFSGSVRGLGIGSEVTVNGLKVGQVTDVGLAYDKSKSVVLAPVRFELDPERVLGVGKEAYTTPKEGVDAMVKAGWRATLESVSLITGQQAVALAIVPDAPSAEVTIEDAHFVIPTVESGGLTSLSSSAADLLKNVNQIPFKQIGASMEAILHSTDEATNGPELKKAVADLGETLSGSKALMADLQRSAAPALHQLPQLTASLQKTIFELDGLLGSLNKGYGNDTKFNRDLERLLVQTNDALRSIRVLADLLVQNPNALISGRPTAAVQ
jgi:paraquat-inducible protein B